MEPFVRRFLKASLAWLVAAVTLGLAMAARPAWAVYRAAHLHAALLGFVAMMIFGVAYHVLPRFTAHPLHSRALAAAHLWLANAGLLALALGFALRVHPGAVRAGAALLAGGGACSALGAYLFAYNLWRTIDGPPGLRAAAARAAAAQRAPGALPQAPQVPAAAPAPAPRAG